MAKTNEIDAQTKGRITKLSKKDANELIQIILRKDNTERKYAEKIKAQAADLSRLYASIETHKKNYEALEEDNVNKIAKVKDSYDEVIALKNTEIDNIKQINNSYKKYKFISVVLACALLGMIVYIMI